MNLLTKYMSAEANPTGFELKFSLHLVGLALADAKYKNKEKYGTHSRHRKI